MVVAAVHPAARACAAALIAALQRVRIIGADDGAVAHWAELTRGLTRDALHWRDWLLAPQPVRRSRAGDRKAVADGWQRRQRKQGWQAGVLAPGPAGQSCQQNNQTGASCA